MSSVRAQIAVFGAVGLLLGGVFYYTRSSKKSAKKADAEAKSTDHNRENLRRWDHAFVELRECLAGDAPASSDLLEAMAIRQIETRDQTSCARLVGALTFSRVVPLEDGEDPPDLPDPEDWVEKRWSQLEHQNSEVAKLYSKHVQKAARLEDPLPAAVTKLVEARDALAKEMGVDPLPAVTGKPLPKATVVDLDPSPTRLTIAPIAPSMGRPFYTATVAQLETVVIAFAPGEKPRMIPAVHGVPAFPEPTWGASIVDDSIAVGKAAAGGLEAPQSVKVVKDLDGIGAVVGTPEQAIVSAWSETGVHVLRGKLGAIVAEKPIPAAWKAHVVDPTGRAVLLWKDKDDHLHVRTLVPGKPDRTVDIGDDKIEDVQQACATRDRVWIGAGGETILGVTLEGAEPAVFRHLASEQILGCTEDAMIARRDDGLDVCSHTTCHAITLDRATRSSREISAFTAVGDKLATVTAHGHVLRLMVEGRPPAYFNAGVDADLAYGLETAPLAMTDGKVVDVIAHTAKGYAVVRLPLPPVAPPAR